MPMGGEETSLDVLESDQVWVLKLVLDGMDPNDFLEVKLPKHSVHSSLDHVLDYLFPRTFYNQTKIER